jgi:large subunit ribosomal protein L15
MKLHDLRPAEGSRKDRIRVGRGIAAGKGKTAGRGTKGQKARAGGGIPPWFEGGQTPLHMRIPKLRGFKNRFKIEFEVVNVGAIQAAVERGAFESAIAERTSAATKPKGDAQITVNQDLLRAVGLVRNLNKPLKILGNGDLSTALFVVADGFTASARSKIEAAGGSVNVLEVPTRPLKAIGLGAESSADTTVEAETATSSPKKAEPKKAKATAKGADEDDAATPTRPKAKASAKAKPAAEPTADAEPEAADAAVDDAPEASATASDADKAPDNMGEPATDSSAETTTDATSDDA